MTLFEPQMKDPFKVLVPKKGLFMVRSESKSILLFELFSAARCNSLTSTETDLWKVQWTIGLSSNVHSGTRKVVSYSLSQSSLGKLGWKLELCCWRANRSSEQGIGVKGSSNHLVAGFSWSFPQDSWSLGYLSVTYLCLVKHCMRGISGKAWLSQPILKL